MEVTHLLVLLLYTIMDVFLRDEYVLRPAAPIVLSNGDVQDTIKVFAASLPYSSDVSRNSCSTNEVYALMISARPPVCARGAGPSTRVQPAGSFPFPPRPVKSRTKSKPRNEEAPPNDPSSGMLHSVNNALLGLKVLYEAHEAARRQGIFRRVQQLVARSFGPHKLTIASIKC